MSDRWPWSARAAEAARIRTELLTPSGGFLLLRGPAGCGKTRLVRESVAGLPLPVHWISGTAASPQVPLSAFAAWIDNEVTDPLRRISDLVARLSARPRQILVIDDIDRLDEQSMLVVHRLRSRPSVTILAVLRDGAPPTTSVTDLLREGTIPVMTVPPLTVEETEEFLRVGLRGRVSAPLAARLWTLTHGNPLYLIALCEANIEQGAIIRRGDFWVIDSELRVPDSLSTTVEAQLGGASDPVLEVVDSVALAEPLAMSVLEHLCASEDIEAAESAGYIVVDDTEPFGGDPHVRIGHPLYAEVRLARASVARLRRLRARLAEQITADHTTDSTASIRRALLAVDADIDPATRDSLILDGATAALHQLNLKLARELTAKALDGPIAIPATLQHGYSLSVSGWGDAAEAALAPLADIDDAETRDTVAFLRAANRFWVFDDAAGARSMVDDEGVGEQTRRMIDFLCDAVSGNPDRALELGSSFPAMDSLPPLFGMFVGWGRIAALGSLGRVREMNDTAKASYQIADTFRAAAYHRAEVGYMHAYFCALTGDLVTLDMIASDVATVTEDVGGGIAVYWAWGIRGLTAVAHGDARDAALSLDATLRDMLACGGPDFMRLPFYIERAYAAALAGDRAVLDECVERLPDPPRGALGYGRDRIDLLACWRSALDGVVSAAIASAVAIAARAREAGLPAPELFALHTALRWGATDHGQRLGELAAELSDVPRAQAAADHALALAQRDGDALCGAATSYRSIGMLDAAADAYAHAAAAYAAADRNGARLSALEHLEELRERLGLNTPAIIAATSDAPIPTRQHEIVTLARRGLSNKAIAERLSLSVRTVEGHIYRAGQRLGEPIRRRDHDD